MRIECPICEYRFEVNDKPAEGKSLKCGSCDQSFSFNESIVVQETTPPALPPAKTANPSLPSSSRRPRSKTAAASPSTKQSPNTSLAASEFDPHTPLIDSSTGDVPATKSAVNTNINAQIMAARRRKSRIQQILFVVAMVAMSTVLMFLLYYSEPLGQWLNGTPATAAGTEDSLDDDPQPTDETGRSEVPVNESAQTGRGLLDGPPQIAKPVETVITYERPRSDFLTNDLLEDIWLKTRPHLLQLNMDTPYGQQQATGVLIDSRGWMLTSYRAVQGASEITVTQSRRTADDDTETLTDLVRGVIAADPEYDLAILLVNRRFVTSFQDLAILETDRVVGSQHLVHCVPPTTQFPWAATECRIDFRRKQSEMDATESSALANRKLNRDDILWIGHHNQSPLNRGSILLTQQGELAGINVAASDLKPGSLAFAVPANHVLDLKRQASNQTTPLPLPRVQPQRRPVASGGPEAPLGNPLPDVLPTLSDGLGSELPQTLVGQPEQSLPMDDVGGPDQQPAIPNMDAPPIPRANAAEVEVLAEESANRVISLNLNQIGNRCREFGWWPTNDDQFGDLQTLAEHLVTVSELSNGPLDESEAETLRAQFEYWTREMQLGIQPAEGLSDEAVAGFNQAMEGALGVADAAFLVFTTVHHGVMESPEIQIDPDALVETLTFRVTGRETMFLVNSNPQWPVMRPGTAWLILGKTARGRVRITGGENQADEVASLARMVFFAESD